MGEAAKGLAWRLAQYVLTLSRQQIPDEVIAKAKAVMLHDLAVAFGGVSDGQTRMALEFIEPRDDGVTVIGHPVRAAPMDAAFANSVMIRALRMEDTLAQSQIHAGASLIPAALAVGEREGASGSEVLCALVAGYDILGRLAGTLWCYDHAGRTASHVFNAFGAAAVAARLMRFDTEQTAGALAYAGNIAAMITHGFWEFQYGIVTRNGLLSAEFGRVRAPYPADAFEAPYGFYAAQYGGARPSDAELFEGLGTRFDIMTTVLKPHPCTAINLVPISLVRRTFGEHGLTGADIRRIRVSRSKGIDRVNHVHSKGPFAEIWPVGAEALSSLPFALAALVLDGEITAAAHETPNAPHRLEAMQRVEIDLRDDGDLFAHQVVIETTDGRAIHLSGGIEQLAVPDANALLDTYARPIVGSAKAERLKTAIHGLDSAADLSEVVDCLA